MVRVSDDTSSTLPRTADPSIGTDVTLESIARALAEPRRRAILSCLRSIDGSITVDQLADAVAERSELPDARDDLSIAFHHCDLPKLADLGVVRYDAEAGEVDVAMGTVTLLETICEAVGEVSQPPRW